jgi:RNA polymerase sigma factor (sigma-70 family)
VTSWRKPSVNRSITLRASANRQRAEAEDLVQTALARSWRAWRSGRIEDPQAFVGKVMINRHATWRGRRVRESVVANVPEAATAADETRCVDNRDAMCRALLTLPSRQRTVLVLRYYEDLSEREIADLMGHLAGDGQEPGGPGPAASREQPQRSGADRWGCCDNSGLGTQRRSSMLLGELTAGFPWGVLLLTDDASTEPIPSWRSEGEQVAACESALVVRVLHGQEGQVTVRVWHVNGQVEGGEAFRGFLEISSGILRVADALSEQVVRLSLKPGRHSVNVYADRPGEATRVDVVISPSA